MLMEDHFDADEILRDIDEGFDDEYSTDEDMRELEFGTQHDERAHYTELASDLDNADELWS